MKITTVFILTTAISLHLLYAQEGKGYDNTQAVAKSYLELPHIEVVPMRDSDANRSYELYVKLPAAYSENKDARYPVIYYTDAMWHLEMLSGTTEYLMENAILIGISWQKDINEAVKQEAGAHASRYRDYSIGKSSNPEHQAKYQFGQAQNHLSFIRKEVISYVEKQYRTDVSKRSYFGYSLGGVFGAYILLAAPDTFKNYILGSPSLQGDIPILSALDSIAATKHRQINSNVFISYGEMETELGQHAEEFIKLLKNRDHKRLSLHHEVIAGSHQTAFPLTVVRGITWLTKRNNLAVVESPYLGQKPPGTTPEPFAPGLVTTDQWEYGGVFSPEQNEFYFIREVKGKKEQEFVVFQYAHKRWQDSVLSARVGQAYIAPDGKTMHLGRRYKERTADGGWSALKKLGSPFEEIQIMRLTASLKGTYVFDEIGMPDGDGVIRYSKLINGKREAPRAFGKAINTGRMNAHPFIAPDESYMLWDGERDSGYGDSDIYISFRQQDGSWGEAINLGDQINTTAWEAAATVTPDGKYLFFNRNIGSDDYENVDIYWVDAQIIETLRPKP